ncbi:ThuA domain-containing protein [Ectobacillus funiculus]|uniref:ThuA domain-containing protein n=1 Tax=Ectobacillus funiculus TaxID=137993 RepID=UPI00397DA2C7
MAQESIAIHIGPRQNRKKAIVIYGVGEQHHPKEVGDILITLLKEQHFEVQSSNTLESLLNAANLKQLDLIVLVWTRGNITQQQLDNLLNAIKAGTGFVGIHASVGAFRSEIKYHELIGGQFLAHPGGINVTYQVYITDKQHPVMKSIQDFTVTTEKYYMLIDPAIHIVAATYFGEVTMPVVWTKSYGKGRVFYNALGHSVDVVTMPQVLDILRRGMVWAAN